MHRFHVPSEHIKDGQAKVHGEELKHLSRVLRLRVGDPVVVFDGQGWEYQGNITALAEDGALVKIETATYLPVESPLQLWLVQGIPKGDKMEWIIQKTTELGLFGVIPWAASRSVVKLEGKKKTEREERWRKIALEAAKQCRRALVPEVTGVMGLKSFLESLPQNYLLLVPWEEGGQPLKNVLGEARKANGEGSAGNSRPVYLVIGPEGGIAEEEVALIREYGGIAVTLGPRILRTETAGLISAALALYELGDLGG